MIKLKWVYYKDNEMFKVTVEEEDHTRQTYLVEQIYRDAVSNFRSFEKTDGEAHCASYEKKSNQAIILQGVSYWNTEIGHEEKPPLGIKPAWLAAQCRVQELAEAIGRQIDAEEPKTDLIRKWAYEIISQVDIYDEDI